MKNKIVIVVRNGIVTDVFGPNGLSIDGVTVLDADVQDYDELDKIDDTVADCINRVRNGELKYIY